MASASDGDEVEVALFDMPNSDRFDILSISIFYRYRYFIDIDNFQNLLINIDIDILQNLHIDIDIFQSSLIDIDILQNPFINIDIF